MLLACLAVASPAQEAKPLEDYRARREALRENLDDGLIVLFGAEEGAGSEAYHLFRQENNFYYLTGLDEPDAVLLLSPPLRDRRSPPWEEFSRLPREILFLPPRDPDQEKWTGPKTDPYDDATPARTGFAVVRGKESLESEIRRYAQGYGVIYTLLAGMHASDTERLLAAERMEKLRAIAPFAQVRDLRGALAVQRQIKSEDEIERIRHAAACTMEALRAAAREIKPGRFEYEIAALIKYTIERLGCERPSFAPIVASGPRATILHYNRNRERLQDGDLLLADVGGESGYYAADITRTFPVNGRFSPRQREIYEIVLGAQEAALKAVKPGARLSGRGSGSLREIAYRYINSHGKDRHGEPLGKYFTHGLSHHVGLDVHDAAAPGGVLQPGMVITVEPGLYLPEENLGVRIEDMVLVTEDGYVLLTATLPRRPDQIEALLQAP